jgi:hypothetical protein
MGSSICGEARPVASSPTPINDGSSSSVPLWWLDEPHQASEDLDLVTTPVNAMVQAEVIDGPTPVNALDQSAEKDVQLPEEVNELEASYFDAGTATQWNWSDRDSLCPDEVSEKSSSSATSGIDVHIITSSSLAFMADVQEDQVHAPPDLDETLA